MEIQICKICKEPIWNFLCAECLARDIREWLPSKYKGFFFGFHRFFSKSFPSDFNNNGSVACLHCKSRELSVCPYCYTNEVFHWLKGKNSDLAHSFKRIFSFDFEGTGYKEVLGMEDMIPITENMVVTGNQGICDECGEYSDELALMDGKWVCSDCAGE